MPHNPHPDHEEIQSVVETASLSAIEAVNRKLIDLIDEVYDLDENSGFEFGDDDMYIRSLSAVGDADGSITERNVAVSRSMYPDPSAGIYYTFEYTELVTEKDEQLITERRTTWSMDPSDMEHAIVEEISTFYGGVAQLKEPTGKRDAGLKPNAMDMRPEEEVWPTQADVGMFTKLAKEIKGE